MSPNTATARPSGDSLNPDMSAGRSLACTGAPDTPLALSGAIHNCCLPLRSDRKYSALPSWLNAGLVSLDPALAASGMGAKPGASVRVR